MNHSRNTLYYDGVTYTLRLLGGFGVSRGIGSVVEAVDGPRAGSLFRADVGRGISSIRGEIDTSREAASDQEIVSQLFLTSEERKALGV